MAGVVPLLLFFLVIFTGGAFAGEAQDVKEAKKTGASIGMMGFALELKTITSI